MTKTDRAFTLLELLLVIIIAAVIAAIAMSAINNNIRKEFGEEAKAALQSIYTQLRLVKNATGSFSIKPNGNIVTGPVIGNVPGFNAGDLASPNFGDSDYVVTSIGPDTFEVTATGSRIKVLGIVIKIDQNGTITERGY